MPSNHAHNERELTIVVTVVAGKECTRRFLATLCSQVSFESTEIIVPYDCWSTPVGELVEEFPEVDFHYINSPAPEPSKGITASDHSLFDRRRAVGLELASGRLVALIEDLAVPAPDWCIKVCGPERWPINVTSAHRLSVALAYFTRIIMLLALWWRPLWLGALTSVLALTVLNRDSYRFFAKRTGFWVALRVVPLHWLYFWYCGLKLCLRHAVSLPRSRI